MPYPIKKPLPASTTPAPSKPSSYTFQLSAAQSNQLRAILEDRGYSFREVPYALFGAHKEKLTLNAYTSGKLLVQGKGAQEFIEFILEPEILGEAKLGYLEVHQPEMFQPHLGIDESGKGDFFGPLVIAGVYTEARTARRLLDIGVRDSKQIGSDKKAEDMADAIKDILGNRWKVIPIGPEKYNQLYAKFRNLNSLLAWGHATVIESLLEIVPDCPRALSDQFANPTVIERALKTKGKQIVMQQRTKAESDIAVAAASILARAEFLRRLRTLGESAGVVLPKGASALTKGIARTIVKQGGAETLYKYTKAHFKTFAEVVGVCAAVTKVVDVQSKESIASEVAERELESRENGESIQVAGMAAATTLNLERKEGTEGIRKPIAEPKPKQVVKGKKKNSVSSPAIASPSSPHFLDSKPIQASAEFEF